MHQRVSIAKMMKSNPSLTGTEVRRLASRGSPTSKIKPLHTRSDLFRNFAASIGATLMVQASLHNIIQSHWQHWRLALVQQPFCTTKERI